MMNIISLGEATPSQHRPPVRQTEATGAMELRYRVHEASLCVAAGLCNLVAMNVEQLVSSPACLPKLKLEEILPLYERLGFHKFEAFTSWCESRLDWRGDPQPYVDLARRHGMGFTSMHLPPVTEDLEASVDEAVSAAQFAQAIGAEVVLFKARSRELYIRAGAMFLDRLEAERIRVTPVLQNHHGSPISTLEDYDEVIRGINDPRMKALLEVGHFARAGVDWRRGYELLEGRIALVHVNDIREGRSVRYGSGEVDFAALFEQLRRDGYGGDIVVELELGAAQEQTLRELADAKDYLAGLMEG
jgi:sugar phosphate isomerase/epimerase